MLKLALTPRWLASLVLALAFATGFMMLSQWQLGSASSKQIHADPAKEVAAPLEDKIQPMQPVLADRADSTVYTSGHYRQGTSRLVGGRVHDGTHGYWVVSQFVPDQQPGGSAEPISLGVARGFTTDSDPAAVPAEPRGDVVVTGRLVANEGPVTSKDAGSTEVLGSAATAQLANVWDARLYSAIVTVDAETPANRGPALDAERHVRADVGLMTPNTGLTPIRAKQYTDDSLDWLNVFYAVEWVVFAGFALYLWWRMLSDAYQRQQHPEKYYELVPANHARYFYEESTGRYFYYDDAAEQYFYFDEPQDSPEEGDPAPAVDSDPDHTR